MKSLPKITIIIPCKNSEKTIQRTFDSIRLQNYENLECIVMDGSSEMVFQAAILIFSSDVCSGTRVFFPKLDFVRSSRLQKV